MNNKYHARIARLILLLTLLFLILAGTGLYFGSRYISDQLLLTNENMSIDIALLVKNNFTITDEEVSYMKSLTFNEMEVDPINQRLMDVGNGVTLNAKINNVYLVSALAPDEIKYTTDAETSEFFGYDVGTALDGIWLLNGKINDDGKFEIAQRDDIYRYTYLTDSQRLHLDAQIPFTEFGSDAWGSFITGYVPVYTTEGSFAGLLGIDMNPDKYQAGAQRVIYTLFAAFAVTSLTMLGLFLYFYFKYIRAREGQLYFDFYSRMSHDMRTPMNGILGMAALSKDENDIDMLHHNFALVEESGQYMLGLINDTLDTQKLDAGKLKLDPKTRKSGKLLQTLVAMVKPSADKKNIAFNVINKGVDLNCFCLVDELRIQQIFMNICSNAIKFTPEGGTITFTLEQLGHHGTISHNRFQISDTGIGMSEDFIHNRLFKPFEQERDSVTTQYGGSGLGLAIVKNLVTLMGGKIEVDSIPGKGTTFTLYLDFELLDAESAANPLLHPSEDQEHSLSVLQGKHILLCEDHPLNAEIASRLLCKIGCKVTLAKNGQEGVDLFSSSPPGTFDVILMDIRMPVMDGLTAARTIRALPRRDAALIPIIAMTANAYDEDIRNCLQAGMNSHIAKPIDPMVMYHTISKSLEP